MHLLRSEHFIGRDFPGIQDLAFQRHDRLIFTVARLFRRTARRIPFDKEQFGAVQVLRGAVRQLTRQRRAAGELFAHHFLGGAQATLGAGDGHLRQQLRRLYVLIQPQAEGVFNHPGDECRALARRQTFFRLPGELRILHLHRQYVRAAIPDIFRRQLNAARQNIAVFAKLAHRVEQPLTQTVNVRTALHSRDQVHVAFGQQFTAFRQPQQRPIHRFRFAGEVADKRFFRQQRQAVDRLAQIII